MPVYGEQREDGCRFKGYRTQGGKRYEHWLSPEAWEKKRIRLADWRRKNYAANLAQKRGEGSAYMRDSRRTRPVVHMLSRARHRAKETGLVFTLTAEDVPLPKTCPVLGVPLEVGGEFAPSIDRIDNSKGYIPGNVVVVSHRVNRLKSDASLDELRAILNFYESL